MHNNSKPIYCLIHTKYHSVRVRNEAHRPTNTHKHTHVYTVAAGYPKPPANRQADRQHTSLPGGNIMNFESLVHIQLKGI